MAAVPQSTAAAAATSVPDRLITALKDAGFATLVTLGLCVPMVTLRTDADDGGRLALYPRFGLTAILCLAVFLARLGYLTLWGKEARAARQPVARKEAIKTVVAPRHTLTTIGLPIALGFAIAYPFLMTLANGGLSEARYWIDLGILVLTYVMLGWGLNVVVGLAGLLDLGYVAFYAIGAYSYAILSTTFHLSFWICLPISGILAASWGVLLGFPVLRLRGDYLAIVTLAFGEIIRLVLINWVPVTNGGAGIASIPRASFFGIPFNDDENGFAAVFGLEFSPMHRIVFLFYLILTLALLTSLVTTRLRRLPVGRAWEALREDEIACRSLGINTTTTKLTAFATGALFGGLAGSFFSVRQGFVSPESFNFLESAIILAIVVLGGMGSQIGVVVAAIAMIAGPEMLRNLGFLKAIFGENFDPNEYRLLIFGLAMVVMMIWRPRGLVSTREPTVFLKERKSISSDLVKEGHG
ncbi:branched-chain amino acid transport system permease protein [Rhizobiales bacterium GAS191]|nr:branched-chain amino acid transport system permease protein [Rhizobiales bacterium GAS113]SEE24094.1 branched-chain amino acid transport system permease protein [Rhizobiales bacterium GAS188]SEE33372.1 branched-chain amino acid transport system permease protein [Rhizobiales bacterium GAS191]